MLQGIVYIATILQCQGNLKFKVT